MMLLVIGGSGSGKSDYAENVLLSLTKNSPIRKYYLATMRIFDREGLEKAVRHKRKRSGKGFRTIEQPVSIGQALAKMEAGGKAALLECVSNLAANEMFLEEVPKSAEQVTEQVIEGIEILKDHLTHLVVVSGNVFEDGRLYDPAIMEYIRAMGMMNRRLASMADQVVEVVVGIPVAVK